MLLKSKLFFAVICFSEAWFLTNPEPYFNPYLNPVVILILGLSIGLLILNLKKENREQNTPLSLFNISNISLTALSIFGFFKLKTSIDAVFKIYPVDKNISDIIPQIQFIVHRFLNGQTPYVFFNDFGYQMFPCYLPFQWLPFISAEKYNFDYRYIPVSVLSVALGFLFFGTLHSRLNLFQKAGVLFLVYYGLSNLVTLQDIIFGATIEALLMGYYILLALCIYKFKNNFVRAFLILLCLLSRFSFLFWLPIYIFIIGVTESKRKAVKLSFLIGAGVFLFYVLPFMIIPNDYTIFSKTQHYYRAATLGEWQHLNPDNKPEHLFKGFGLACYFYTYLKGDLWNRLHYLQLTGLAVSFCTMSGLIFRFWKSKTALNPTNFALGALKIMLTVFYAFVQIPYAYLFLVPLGVTMVLLFVFFDSSTS